MSQFVLFLQASEPTGIYKVFLENSTFIFFALVLLVFYFFIIRPQNQQRKKADSFVESLVKGKKVVTIGGIHGLITEVTDKTVTIVVDQRSKSKLTLNKASISMEMTASVSGDSGSNNGKTE